MMIPTKGGASLNFMSCLKMPYGLEASPSSEAVLVAQLQINSSTIMNIGRNNHTM
jgi:hypothetical protein